MDTVSLNILIKKLKDIQGIQDDDPSTKTDDYLRGMRNGIELALATAEDREPDYI